MSKPDCHPFVGKTSPQEALIVMVKPRFEFSALEEKDQFREALGAWYSKVGKDFPWRRTNDPYRVLVSEMMLQQTQVTTVLSKGYYTRFLEKFPDLPSLCNADDESLLKAWEGLGYYRRARMLRNTARAVVENHGGRFPDHEASLLTLPGIGPYTAAALMAFSFGKVSALVDGNVSRILSRLMDDSAPIDSSFAKRMHTDWAAELCDPSDPGRHHHAMMELGQNVCRPGLPACEKCPVAGFCKCSDPVTLPNKKPRVRITDVEENAVFVRDSAGRILLNQESGKRRNGLWKLPLRAANQCRELQKIYESSYPITRYKVSLKVYSTTPENALHLEPGDEWVTQERLELLPIAAPFRKALLQLTADF